MKKLYFLTAFALITFFDVSAQQDPHYTQYMYNMSVINPAYAGSKENLTGGLLFRKQWINVDGAPTTATFFANSPIGKNVGLGVSAISDRLGPVEENNLYADFSYTLKLSGEHRLAFGLKGGGTFHKVGLLDQVYNNVPDAGDGSFSQNSSRSFLNLGSGLFYYTNKYYVAFSVPNMLKANYLSYNGQKFGSEVLHYFLTGGYVFDLNPNLKFKPSTMIKSSFNSPTSIDLSANFLFNQKFEVGATYRRQDSFGAMVNYAVSPSLKIGYAYDQITSSLKTTTPSSHEVIILFDLNFPKKVSQSPRYF
ncbi:type IX secretion system membrane protein PorP/SprF [Flavobacterium sp. SUN046]|uniref:PorP/SprF family type IX secretion system membrane protein n=1 Tax=Flavobacterium sp. SUN046 TaxID=3002440 RepID=UPI002DB89212|nr:type IX secretion system membrane protein PorP/SprF [Flavobacterium sp. SUN046]MEC4048124.1 type IX secretion system membrane protein PorP/SprF [Flavobacterium sp. SUN046]